MGQTRNRWQEPRPPAPPEERPGATVTAPGETGGFLEAGSPSAGMAPARAGRAPHIGEEAHSMSRVSDSAGRHSPRLRRPCTATGGPPVRRDPPDSPNCPPALASAPSLLLPNCMSESSVRGDMGRSMVLLKEVLVEGGKSRETFGVSARAEPCDTLSPRRRAPGHGPAARECSRGKGPGRGSRALRSGQRAAACPAPTQPGSRTAPGRDRAEGGQDPPSEAEHADTPGTLTE